MNYSTVMDISFSDDLLLGSEFIPEDWIDLFGNPGEFHGETTIDFPSFHEASNWVESELMQDNLHSSMDLDLDDMITNFISLPEVGQQSDQSLGFDIDTCPPESSPRSNLPSEGSATEFMPPHTKSSLGKLSDCLYEFEGVPGAESKGRKRKRFASERRKEVDQLRKVGACIRCKLTKSPVSRSHCVLDLV